jgi:hypothetical protein
MADLFAGARRAFDAAPAARLGARPFAPLRAGLFDDRRAFPFLRAGGLPAAVA